MPRLVIEIDLDNDAFQDGNRGAEIEDILGTLGCVIATENESFGFITIFDSNGNAVGRAEIEDDE